MRVAVVYPVEFGAQGYYGGGERYAYELARALSERVDCRLMVAGPRRTTRRDGRLRVDVHRALLVGGYSNPLTAGILPGIAGTDVVHCIFYGSLITDLAVIAGRLGGKRVFITDVGVGAAWMVNRYADVARLSHGLLPLSEFSNSRFSTPVPRRVIYGGVDTARYSPGGASDRDQVVFLGRLLPHKGIDYLVKAMPADLRLVVVGRPYDDAYFYLLRDLARDKQVVFVTDGDDDRVIAELRRATVAVLPSVHDNCYGEHSAIPELFGLSVVEAMSCETPVICTNVGSLPEIVEDGVSGLLVPPNDPVALRRAIERIRNDPESARAMGRAARRRVVDKFTWDRVAQTCLSAYQELR